MKNRLKELRSARGWTQEELGKRLGKVAALAGIQYPQTCISSIE